MKEIDLHPKIIRKLSSKRIRRLLQVIKSLGPKGVVIIECKAKDIQQFKTQTRAILKKYFPKETFFFYQIPCTPKEGTKFLIRPYPGNGLANVESEQAVLSDVSEWLDKCQGFYVRRKAAVPVQKNKASPSKRNPRKTKRR